MNPIDKINELLQASIQDQAFPGVCYAIVTKQKTFMACLGDRAWLPKREINTIDTLYDIASLSKVVSTTSCAMKLVEEGRIRLFDKVIKFIPEYRHQQVTIFDLMTHTSGMSPCVPHAAELMTADEAWETLLGTDLVYEPNTVINYSCMGYIVLGKIIERVTGKSLDQYAKEVLFDPLDMKDTCYNPRDVDRCAPTEKRDDRAYRGIIRGKVHDETAFALNGVSGNAGVFSTIEDMTHFIQMILNDGKYRGKQILSKATIDTLFLPQVATQKGIVMQAEIRGLGWIKRGTASSAGELTSLNTILHTGFTGTNMWIDRDNEVGFCMLTNRVHPTRDNPKMIEIRPRIANMVMANLTFFKEQVND